MATEKLCRDSTKHDEHEKEEDHDVKHDGQRVQDCGDQTRHIRNLVDGTKRSEDSDNFNGWDITTFENLWDPTKDNDHKIENVPRISQVTVSSHEKAHCDDLEDHFHCIDVKEDEIDLLVVLSDHLDFLIERQKDTVDQDDKQDESIEPWINSHNLDDLVSEWICNW